MGTNWRMPAGLHTAAPRLPRLRQVALRDGHPRQMVAGVVPVEPPTPALSNVTTRRAGASASISAGSQLSRFPRKCWSRTSGTAPWSPPVSR
jgi:hypothetical protein